MIDHVLYKWPVPFVVVGFGILIQFLDNFPNEAVKYHLNALAGNLIPASAYSPL